MYVGYFINAVQNSCNPEQLEHLNGVNTHKWKSWNGISSAWTELDVFLSLDFISLFLLAASDSLVSERQRSQTPSVLITCIWLQWTFFLNFCHPTSLLQKNYRHLYTGAASHVHLLTTRIEKSEIGLEFSSPGGILSTLLKSKEQNDGA